MKATFLFIALLWSVLTRASELDQFTHRYLPLADSLEIINQRFDQELLTALVSANKKSGCGEKRLYKTLRKYFSNHYTSKFTKWII